MKTLWLRNVQLMRCWCGACGTFEELFCQDFEENCGGGGYIDCHCGGDFCVCHNHGGYDCPGCPDCEEERDYDWQDDYDDEDY